MNEIIGIDNTYPYPYASNHTPKKSTLSNQHLKLNRNKKNKTHFSEMFQWFTTVRISVSFIFFSISVEHLSSMFS